MIISNNFANGNEFKEYVNNNNQNFQFVFYDNNNDNKNLQIIKANEIPKDFQYKVKEPVKKAVKKCMYSDTKLW